MVVAAQDQVQPDRPVGEPLVVWLPHVRQREHRVRARGAEGGRARRRGRHKVRVAEVRAVDGDERVEPVGLHQAQDAHPHAAGGVEERRPRHPPAAAAAATGGGGAAVAVAAAVPAAVTVPVGVPIASTTPVTVAVAVAVTRQHPIRQHPPGVPPRRVEQPPQRGRPIVKVVVAQRRRVDAQVREDGGHVGAPVGGRQHRRGEGVAGKERQRRRRVAAVVVAGGHGVGG